MTDRDILPASVKASNYAISLFDLELGGQWSFQGVVEISLALKEAVSEITLNTKDIKIHEASIRPDKSKTESLKATKITYNEKAQQATIAFDNSLGVSSEASLIIRYAGTMNNRMDGFYRSRYTSTHSVAKSVPFDGEFYYMFSTQFEACDARAAFPCFDEPNLKATFDVEIEIPDDQTALSNMPEKFTKTSKKSGFKVVGFEKTPVMSTYLLAWAFGDLEYVEGFTERQYNSKKLPIRVYTTRGLKEQGRYALGNACKVIDLFSDIFQIEYPLPKSDLLAVPEYSMGAMENWGLVTYRTTAVLFDEGTSDEKFKNRIAYVVAHELAHQWFGNLVTMDWWNELFLNEGFATWVGWYAVNELHPEWSVWAQFVSEGYQQALSLDALRKSHPIDVPVRDALEVGQIFDAISYLKGSSVIRMLSSHIGVKTFLQGVANYLKAHAYGNATVDDLWTALSEASGQDVKAFMDPWLRKMGYPVVTVAEEPGQISLRQSRFLTSGDVQPEDDETTWWIPLGIRNGANSTEKSSTALKAKEETLRDISTEFYKINTDHTAFYRTNYPPQRLQQLGAAKDTLSLEDRIGLIGDASALATSGEGTTAGLLSFVEEFQSEKNFLVWSQILSAISNVRSIFADNDAVAAALKSFTLKLVTPAVERLGWAFDPQEDYLTSQLRPLLIAAAARAGHQGIIAEAQRRFHLYTSGQDPKAIHTNLRSAIWQIAIANGGKAEYEALKHEYLTTASVDGKEIALGALGRVTDQALAEDFFAFLISDRVTVQDIHSGTTALSTHKKMRYVQWECIKRDWAQVGVKLAANRIIIDRVLRLCLNKFTTVEAAKDIEDFFKDKDTKGYDRSLGVVVDTIHSRAKYRERDEALVGEWLAAHGYQ